MPSHLLANSAFSGMDIYRSGRSTRSKPLLPPPTVPIVQSITPLDAARRSSLALPDALLPVASSPPIPERSTSLSGDILLNSPTTDESASDQRHHATSIDMEGEARRGPVQMANVVNWARPFVSEAEERFLFGQSNQRQRRMGKAAPISPYIDSPSSASSDEESLPVTPGSASFFPSLPFVQATALAGLGMGMDITKTERRVQWSQKQEVARRIHSLPSGAPATLEELRRLKSAAQELEDEVRGRMIVPMSESPMLEQKDLPVVPITVLRGRRIRRKAVPTIMTLDADIVTVHEPQVFTLEVAPLPDTPRSTGSSSHSFSSGPFDLSAGCSSSDNDSSPPQTPPHAMVAFSPPMTPMRVSSSESSGLRRSPGVAAGLTVSASLPLYVPSIHGEIDGWWSSSDDEIDGHGDEADIDTESDSSPSPGSQPTFAPQAIASTPIRRAPGFHMRSVSDDTAAQIQQARKNFYGNKTAFMSSFFGKPSTSSTSEAAASPKRSSTTKATPPSAWGKHASVGVSSVSSTSSSSSSSPASPTPKAGRRTSLQFLSPRVVSPTDCAGGEEWTPDPPADSPKKSFYANNKAFRSVMDLGSMRKAGKDKDREEKSMAPHDSATRKRGISKFFRKLVI